MSAQHSSTSQSGTSKPQATETDAQDETEKPSKHSVDKDSLDDEPNDGPIQSESRQRNSGLKSESKDKTSPEFGLEVAGKSLSASSIHSEKGQKSPDQEPDDTATHSEDKFDERNSQEYSASNQDNTNRNSSDTNITKDSDGVDKTQTEDLSDDKHSEAVIGDGFEFKHVDGEDVRYTPNPYDKDGSGYSEDEFEPSPDDSNNESVMSHITNSAKRRESTESISGVKSKSISEGENLNDTQMKAKNDAKVSDLLDTVSETSSMRRNSTFVKPESSFVSNGDDKKLKHENTSEKKRLKIDEREKSKEKDDTMSSHPGKTASNGESQREAWSEKDKDGGDTIEDVASNFMQRVQRTEDENRKLLEDNQRLLGKLKLADENEQKLVNEIHIFKKEQDELTSEHVKVKDENMALLKRVADAKREKDAQRQVFVEENDFLRSEIKSLEKSALSMKQKLSETEENVQNVSAKSKDNETLMKTMRDELVELREAKRKSDEDNKEVETLKNDLKHRDDSIRELNEELASLITETSDLKIMEDELVTCRQRLSDRVKELERKEEYINSLDKEKAMLCDELSKLRASFKEKQKEADDLRKRKESLANTKKALEKTVDSLKIENKELKATKESSSSEVDAREALEAEIKDLKAKIEIMKTTERALSDLMMSKQNHIADLRNENAELRNTSKIFKQDVDDLRGQLTDRSVATDKYADIVDNHKKILDENKRLRNMMATKSIHETNAATEKSELVAEIDVLENKLAKADKRIGQLEKWMDDIFSGQEYEMIPKNGVSRGSMLSLPEIPMPDTSRSKKTGRMTHRKGPQVQRFDTSSLGVHPR